MRALKRGIRWGAYKFVPRAFNILVIFGLVFQPVGTPGIWNVALAQSVEPDVVASADQTAAQAAADAQTVADAAKAAADVQAAAAADQAATDVADQTAAAQAAAQAEADATAKVTADAAQAAADVEAAAISTEKAVSAEETAPTDSAVVSAEVSPEIPALSQEIWSKDGNTATTNDPVQTGMTYVAPQNDQVTVAFTKLLDNPGTFSIEEITLTDEQVASLGALSNKAYDVTSSMKDGTFEYKLTLPIPQDKKNVRVKYAEDADDIENAETVQGKDVETHRNSVSVSLDHFTLFIITTYSDAAFSIEENEYVPGDTVYVKGTNLDDTKYYRIALDPPTGSQSFLNTCFNPDSDVTTLTDSYILSSDAVLGSWAAELKEYTTSNCTGIHTDVSDAFSVVAPAEPEHTPVTFCHATPPDTAANGYQELTTDDDGVLSGHAPQDSADIIPPFDYYDGHFDGQNWDAVGQAIWRNNCTVTGGLKAIKVVDDESDLTQWSFQLDSNTPISADVNGEVDFGQVSVGQHTLTEIGLATYSIVSVSGTNCARVPDTLSATAEVALGSPTVCTFSNAVDKGSITIVKDADPTDEQDFNFTTTGDGIVAFALDDDGDNSNTLSNTRTFSGLFPGAYSITEEDVARWDLMSIGCTGNERSFGSTESAVAFDLAAGENITCTFANTKQSVVTGMKWNDENGDRQNDDESGIAGWTIDLFRTSVVDDALVIEVTPVETTTTDSAGNYSFSNLDPAQNYIVCEETRSGWEQTSPIFRSDGTVTCANGTVGYSIQGSGESDTFSLRNFGNQGQGTIIIEKDVVPDGDVTFDFTIEGDLIETIGFSLGDGGVSDSHVLPAATYTVSEESDDSLYTTSVACVSNQEDTESADSLSLDPGETITCTYTNTLNVPEDTGSITIVKDANPESAQNFGYAMNGAGFVEFVLDDDADSLLSNTATFASLAPGTYTVTEGLVSGWALESITCTSDIQSLATTTDPIRTIELGAGENVTCTYLNTQNASAPVCGDGTVNQETEQCDGTDGVTEGVNFCTFSCQLVPVYTGGNTCSEGTEPVLVQTKFVESFMTDGIIPDPTVVSLEGGKEYLIESVGHFGYGGVPHNNTLNRADAGYASDTNWVGPNVDTVFGSPVTALYRGIHSLISDMGTGTFGVVDWGTYNASHIYAKHFTPAVNTDIQFAISDWYDTWYSGDELSDFNKNQFGFRDNDSGLTLNVYECQEPSAPQSVVTGMKWNDENGDRQNDDESGIAGWTIDLFRTSVVDDALVIEVTPVETTTTDSAGNYSFSNLDPAQNYIVCEETRSGWEQTSPIFRSDGTVTCANGTVGYSIQGSGESDTFSLRNFGNQENPNEPTLSIEKSNDSVGDEQPGNSVLYTLRVTANDNDVLGVTVTDLPPAGFTYEPGSGTGAPFLHGYASPGVWNVGDMTAGQTVTLTYRATISGSQDDGLYKDLAYATGTSESGVPVVANDPVDADNFVGTQVKVARAEILATVVIPEDDENKIKEKTVKKTKYVLGAATTLPMTGANTDTILLALMMLLSGLILLLLSKRSTWMLMHSLRKSLLKVFFFAVFAGSFLVSGQTASAAANLSVQIETPETLVQSPDFQIGFVALDILGRAVTVECFKNSDALPFASYPLAAGGSSGNCQINAAVMPVDGDYAFYVKAIASGEGSETVESNHVNVKLVSTVPGTPYNYDRNDGSCLNNITFTTADDAGKTVKVELYRSLSTSFAADASTKAAEQVIGSDVAGAFSVAAPGCSNDYFYALRAVNASGFGSGFVGDKDVNVDTHTVTKTKTTTITTPGAASAGAIAVTGTGAGAEAGQVEGAETTNEETVPDETEAVGGSGSVLGEMTEAAGEVAGGFADWIASHPWWSALIALIALALGYYGYETYQRKRNEPLQ